MLIKSKFRLDDGVFNLRPAHRLAQNGCKVSGFLSIDQENRPKKHKFHEIFQRFTFTYALCRHSC